MPSLDTGQISRQLVRALRGRRSQQALSRRLGFGSNVVYTWESGRRAPEASRFFRLAELCGVSLGPAVTGFFKSPEPSLARARFATPRGVQRLVESLIGSATKTHIAERVGVDRTTLARWLHGRTEPRFPDLLRLVDVATQRLLPFIERFVDPRALPATLAAFEDLAAQQRLAYELPWSHAVLRALELEEYSKLECHERGFLAERLGITEEQEARCLDALARAGQIHWSAGRWQIGRVLTVDTRTDPQRDHHLKLHWAEAALGRLRASAHAPEALFSYNLFAVSEEHFQRIRQLHLDYYDALRALVDESPRADRVVLVNVQLLPLGMARVEPV